MGGRGSGRSSYSGKAETSDSTPLDIRKIAAKACWRRAVALLAGAVDGERPTGGGHPHPGGLPRGRGAVLPHEEHWRGGRAAGADANIACHLGGQRHWSPAHGAANG